MLEAATLTKICKKISFKISVLHSV